MKPDVLQPPRSMLVPGFPPYGIRARILITRGLTLIQPARETTRTITVSVSYVQRLFAVVDVLYNFELFHFLFSGVVFKKALTKDISSTFTRLV
ncbi:hypothetical protein ASPFODRAFT_53972 [Aspergillus luchuensis CBS 106.47]|uniref:Uncharacterized protein n=1 Tax=Aspergillus luchuensis (strain CBS 106.47) TaxID=1137211 RepID=A0A1M3T039_ASPLC|nr:hypothetical protein ASPFODRAFT_53972 [Aspergillus luchuensis CBS 106.47]